MHRFYTALLLCAAAGCAPREAPRAASQPAQVPARPRSQPAVDWQTYNGTLTGERFANVDALTPAAASRLQRTCVFDTGKDLSAQTGPVVVAGTMYLSDEDTTYAIDAATCKERWRHTRDVAEKGMLRNNRGLAYSAGKLVRGYADGHVEAIDARSGRLLWDVALADPKRGESLPMAPLAWRDLVYIGNAGGDNYGVTGHIFALRLADGSQAWKLDTIPDTEEVRQSWPQRSEKNQPTGGALWTTFSLDPERGVLFAAAGNAAPDFMIDLRAGKTLYANAVLALDARAGTLLGYVQPVGDDQHDHDVAAAPALITTRGGKRLALEPAKDGRLYAIDIANVQGELPVIYHLDTTTRDNLETKLSTTTPVRFCPGTQGGSEWNGAAYSPELDRAFVAAVDWCTTVQLQPSDKLLGSVKPGMPFTGEADPNSPFGKMDPPDKWSGWLTAFDADTGQITWRYHAPAPILAGVTVTSGGVVFAADLKGTLRAFDAHDGKIVFEQRSGNATGGGLIAYAIAGTPYVAVVTGQPSPLWPVDPKATAQVAIYSVR